MRASENLSLLAAQTIEIGSPVTQIRVADIDRDLKKDLVVSVREGVKILRNLSTSGNVSLELVPGLSLQFGNADAPIGSAASDFNRDGFVDLAIAGYESGNVQLLLGTSNVFSSTFGPLPLDLSPFGAPGCFGRVSDDALQMFNIGFNGVQFPLAIPNDLAFFGLTLHTQAIVFENVNPLGLTVSDAATMVIGG